MSVKWLAAAFLCSSLVYCGGGKGGGGAGSSGLPPGSTVASLSAADLRKFCEYVSSLQESPKRAVDCNGTTLMVGINPEDLQGEIDDCISGAPSGTCPATVGQAEDCFEALGTEGLTDAEICTLFMSDTPPPACEPLNVPSCE